MYPVNKVIGIMFIEFVLNTEAYNRAGSRAPNPKAVHPPPVWAIYVLASIAAAPRKPVQKPPEHASP